MLVRKGQFLFTCRLAGCWKRRLHRGKLTSTWLTRKKKNQTFALCFVLWMFFITFSLSATTHKKITLGSSYAIASECFFEIPWMKPVWKKRKKKKTISSTHYGNLPKVPLKFYSLRNRSNLCMWHGRGRERRICF